MKSVEKVLLAFIFTGAQAKGYLVIDPSILKSIVTDPEFEALQDTIKKIKNIHSLYRITIIGEKAFRFTVNISIPKQEASQS